MWWTTGAVFGLAVCGALLYRLRGGWFHDLTGIRSTQLMRAIWSLPTAVLMTVAFAAPWWVAGLVFVSIFAGLALIGHGAHMIMDSKVFKASTGTKTEMLTAWWLPALHGGIPDITWHDDRVMSYQIWGMSFIGLVRNTIAVLPMLWLAPVWWLAPIYAATGALHGFWYWCGWRFSGSDSSQFSQNRAAELFVGFNTWGVLAIFMVQMWQNAKHLG